MYESQSRPKSLDQVHDVPGEPVEPFEPGQPGAPGESRQDEPVDHRRLGRDLDIFTGDELVGAGFPLWLPDGAAVVAELERYVLDLERRQGYRHVRTPAVGKRALYERSGHWQHFGPDMFPPFRVGGEDLVLRPVLCPHHALVYRSRLRSHRELPLRIGEVGSMYRMERSGVVGGLTRVRGITLNDAHIFCPPEEAAREAVRALAMIDEAYDVLGIRAAYHRLSLPGPPEEGKSYAGEPSMWERAEAILRDALDQHGVRVREVRGEAAFYGPKIDVQVYDAHGREFTLSTVQVDLFQPERFDLEYVAPDGSRRRPAMVHRSVLASMERMMAYLLEAHAGALPPWLAPVQVLVLPVSPEQAEAARAVAQRAEGAGLRVDVDDRDESLGARVRAARPRRVPYLAVVGGREAEAGTVAVRLRDDRRLPAMPVDAFVDAVASVVADRRLDLGLTD
ncbi:threonine--tRNA ligase [Actinopolymorpha sp. NPDC004070]|uniref:threonine--tRNA ligase n=1 Tax=Actinopolymorpha sp. NPDC004070 TaxID=3154548 RepID=UPI0033A46B4E